MSATEGQAPVRSQMTMQDQSPMASPQAPKKRRRIIDVTTLSHMSRHERAKRAVRTDPKPATTATIDDHVGCECLGLATDGCPIHNRS
jgi:hypothetical protein